MYTLSQLLKSGLLFVLCLIVFNAYGKTSPQLWNEIASDISKEEGSVQYKMAVQKLNGLPDLEELLTNEIIQGGDEHNELVFKILREVPKPQLSELILQHSLKDKLGFSYLSLGLILSKPISPNISKTLYERVLKNDTTVPSKIAIFQLFSQFQNTLTLQQNFDVIEYSFKQDNYDLRLSSVQYLYKLVSKENWDQFEPLVQKVMKTNPYQVRLWGAYILEKIGSNSLSASAKKIQLECQKNEINEVVKKACFF